MLRHAFFLDGQERFEEGIWLMSNGGLVMKIKRLVRASVLDRRNMSQACVKKGIGLTESNKVLTSWASFSIPVIIPRVRYFWLVTFGNILGTPTTADATSASWNRQRCGQTISGIMKGGCMSVSAFI